MFQPCIAFSAEQDSHPVAMKVCWLASGETLTLLDPKDFVGKPILEAKQFLKTLVQAPTYEQRLFMEDGSVETKDEDLLDPTDQTLRLMVSKVSLQDIIEFSVTPLPVCYWPHQPANPTVMKAYGQAYEVALALENGRDHRDKATYWMNGTASSFFALQEWPLLLKMCPNVAEGHRWCSMKKCHAVCPEHVPFPVGTIATQLSGQGAFFLSSSAVLLAEDVGETLTSRCANVADGVVSDAECDVMMRRWLCEIVAVTEELHGKGILWYLSFHPKTVCWNHRVKRRWYLSRPNFDESIGSLYGTTTTFEMRWRRVAKALLRDKWGADRAMTMFLNLVVENFAKRCEPMTAEELLRKLGVPVSISLKRAAPDAGPS